MTIKILCGDVVEQLRTLPVQSVQCVVTSPPYYGLRDYGIDGQIGLEDTPEEYVQKIVGVFREVRRVMRDDGVLFLNLGDSYWANRAENGEMGGLGKTAKAGREQQGRAGCGKHPIIKPKDLIGIPWMVAFALRADGWYLRSDIIWSKPNPMPESVTDRPTKAHEYVFLLTKKAHYYYDADAIREPLAECTIQRYEYGWNGNKSGNHTPSEKEGTITGNTFKQAKGTGKPLKEILQDHGGRNRRTVWEIATQPTPEAHFATFPEALVEPCIKAGSKPGDTVLDPFGGSGTTAKVARELKRDCILIEINPAYISIAKERLRLNEQLGDFV